MGQAKIINELKEADLVYKSGLKKIDEKRYKIAKRDLRKAALMKLEIAAYAQSLEKAHLLKDVKNIFSKIKSIDAEKP